VRPAESAIQDATPTESYGNFSLEKVTVLLMARWLSVKNRKTVRKLAGDDPG
jgi:hypothetical protein